MIPGTFVALRPQTNQLFLSRKRTHLFTTTGGLDPAHAAIGIYSVGNGYTGIPGMKEKPLLKDMVWNT